MDAMGRPTVTSTSIYGLSKLAIMLNRIIIRQEAVILNSMADYAVPAVGSGAGRLSGEPPIAIAEVAAPVGGMNKVVFI